MKRIFKTTTIFIILVWPLITEADIYTWTDNKGVQHYTNQSPQPGATIYLKDSGPKPTYLPETTNQIENNDPTANDHELENQLKDTREKLSKTYEKLKLLENKFNEAQAHINENDESTYNIAPKVNHKDSLSITPGSESKIYVYSGDLNRSYRQHKRSGRYPINSYSPALVRHYYHEDNHQFGRRIEKNSGYGNRYPHRYKLKPRAKSVLRKSADQREVRPSATLNRSRRFGVFQTRSQLRKSHQPDYSQIRRHRQMIKKAPRLSRSSKY